MSNEDKQQLISEIEDLKFKYKKKGHFFVKRDKVLIEGLQIRALNDVIKIINKL